MVEGVVVILEWYTAESGLGLNGTDAGFLLREGSEQVGLRQQCIIVSLW